MQENINIQSFNETEEPEFSFRLLFNKWLGNIRYTLRYWRWLLIAGIIGGGCLGIYTRLKSPTYTASLTFVVEETKAGGGSVLSALSGSLGIDIGSISGGGSLLAGDNVLQLIKSHSLIKKTLLTPYPDSGTYSLADKYADTYDLKSKWAENKKIGKQINFTANKTDFTRLEDSLLQTIVTRIDEKELEIAKPDKKLDIFNIEATMRDETLSQLFSERILNTTTDFYIETKTRRLRANVDRLQKRADSINTLLNRKTQSATESETLLLDANPIYSSPAVKAEISGREKMTIGAIYGEIVRNLEISKTALIQETPTVQIVDYPELPLKKNKLSLLLYATAGFVAASFLMGFFIISQKKTGHK